MIPTEPSPLEGKLPIAAEMMQLRREINRVERKIDEHTATADTAYVGADRRKHYDDHLSIHQREMDRREFWKKLIPQVVGGLIMAAVGGIVVMAVFFLQNGGGK